jgi:hypothetical protein
VFLGYEAYFQISWKLEWAKLEIILGFIQIYFFASLIFPFDWKLREMMEKSKIFGSFEIWFAKYSSKL